jgi:ethanolamine utilization protein EutA (predicted chaperonin)
VCCILNLKIGGFTSSFSNVEHGKCSVDVSTILHAVDTVFSNPFAVT